ncbi:tRNA lysidine(34) synthetase TilS [bacterium]|nr:tRNA lysidine(34) synthetase TilS [bacterium]
MLTQEKFNQTCLKIVSPNDFCGIAVSGGADSVTLLSLANIFFTQKPCVIHVNHLLRGEESNQDEIFVREICEKLELKFFSKKCEVLAFAEKNKLGIEEAARILRYEFLNEIWQKENLKMIFTAHHKNDNVETFFLKFLIGSSFENLKGIPQKRGFFFRPLLDFSKNEILDFAEKNGLSFRKDSSNDQNNFLRNKIRNEILPFLEEKIPNFSNEILLNHLKNFEESDDFFEKEAQNEISKVLISKTEGKIIVDRSLFVCYFEKILVKFMEIFVSELSSKKINHLQVSTKKDLLFFLKTAKTGSSKKIVDKILVFANRNTLEFIHSDFFEPEREIKTGEKIRWKNKEISVCRVDFSEFSSDKNIEFVSADNLNEKLTVRSYQKGDKFFPLGMKNAKKLSDFFIDLKIPKSEKAEIPLLVSGNEIVWICGFRISEKFKVLPETKKIMKLEFKDLKES